MKLNEQIAYLRKQKGMTQEELAGRLGVTNQSVSKWESAQCCPDIGLLPAIADIFGVSIDTLMGREKQDSFENLYMQVKAYFTETPAEKIFRDSFRLSVLLHEIVCTDGYKNTVPWDTGKEHGLETEPHKWGMSVRAEPDGCAMYVENGILLSYNGTWTCPQTAQIRGIASVMKELADTDILRVLFALYDLTVDDFDRFVSAEEIGEKARLSVDVVEEALETLDLTVQESETGELLYRIDGSRMHIPVLLMMLRRM